ncbi:MAG: hypothetical protein A3C88_00755 [Candidatus Yanofskybacteria bacterium RIFCSPHIGHO2_02_FULL_50_12]|uniref:Homing endonuclease LAGLIDADG domain-containing protein n=1 Tax=Candidatus Yanofskybacteria bacterium RIFCSPHIGHO2_02_FULL_50_12 TaxID=1802685 RepID=A0A1F8FX95_9BACT|nr:MAG: hypothetical protein A3C88_00755 [Candidatus Yanofskybacteria bacterium RIFCSPHIGHO2_02_FULL_50_12]
MAKPRKISDLSSEDAAYIAGIIDGEGTVTLVRKNKKENRRLAVTISNTEFDMLNWIKKKVNAGVIVNKHSTNGKWAEAFTYQVYNRQAYDLLSKTYTYMRSHKRKRAELALREYLKVTPRNGKYTPELLVKRNKFIEDFFKIRCSLKIGPVLN